MRVHLTITACNELSQLDKVARRSSRAVELFVLRPSNSNSDRVHIECHAINEFCASPSIEGTKKVALGGLLS